MSTPTPPHHLSRRRFLRVAGLATSACVTAPLLATTALAAPAQPLRIGVVLPQSVRQPRLAEDMLSGLRQAFAQRGGSIAGRPVLLQPTSYGTSPMRALATARELAANPRIDLITGLFDDQAATLASQLEQAQLPMLLGGFGANVPGAAASEYQIQSNLGFWQSNWALGAWAGHQIGQRVVMVSAFYESGYDVVYAFRHGFEAAGGQLLDLHVTHRPQGSPLADTLAAIKGAQPDMVYALYSGQQALEFVREYQHSGLAGRIPLLGSNFLVDETLLPSHGSAASGIISATSWAPGQGSGNSARILGQQLGQHIATAATQSGGSVRHSAAFLEALRQAVATPGSTAGQPAIIYLRQVQAAAGRVQVTSLGELAAPAPAVAQALRGTQRKTGWLNSYMCV